MSDTKIEVTIIGIAASAGGLEATSLLAQNLPSDQACAYILAQHMSPSHKSMMVQLLSRETRLDVQEVQTRTRPRANTIYIPPPGYDVVIENGELVLEEPQGRVATPKPSADRLFKSIARELGERSIGVVLSGTGSDGSYGVQAIREAGGITIAQEPNSSKFDSMPMSAIRTGCIDLTLTPQQIGQHLETILARPRDLDELKRAHDTARANSDLFQVLLAHSLVDFRQYKESTINRRIQRRMIARGVETLSDYIDLCRQSTEEADALYRDLLISVTNFFRDPEQFLALAEVLTEKVAKSPSETIRVWVPGCATGEEAYSIAIVIAEALGGLENVAKDRLQIFATDIDDRALEIGRRGIYPSSAVNDIPPQYLGSYFDVAGDHLTVKPRLRNLVMFSHHNVFQDAPFITLDLVSIRNVLIYFKAKLQERVLSRIQYALKSDGLLFLGTSESTGVLENFFVPISQRFKIFRKRATAATSIPTATQRRLRRDLPSAPAGNRVQKEAQPAEYWLRFDGLCRAVVTNGFLTNRDMSVLKIYGDLAPFIELREPFQSGMTVSVLKNTLAYTVNSMVRAVIKTGEKRAGQWLEVEGPGFNAVRITSYPITGGADEDTLVLVGLDTELRAEPDSGAIERSDYLEYLETELARTKDTLNVTIEELQTSNEELQSLNEELQSANEELQSTNEELETSNEELQSTNEELITVNEELIVNSSELERTTAELNGLVRGLPAEMMMLDQGLQIRHASRKAVRTFRLKRNGHSFGHLSQCHIPPELPSLLDICSQVLLERQVQHKQYEVSERLYTLTVSPLLADNDELIGLNLVINSADLRIDHALNRTLRNFDNIGTWQLTVANGEVIWSDEVFTIHGLPKDSDISGLEGGLGYFHEDDREMVRAQVREVSEHGGRFHFFARLNRADGRTIIVESSGAAVMDGMENTLAIVGVIRDVTRMHNEDMLVRHFNAIMAEDGIGFYSCDMAHNLPYMSPQLFDLLGLDKTQPPSLDAALALFPEEPRARIDAAMKAALDTQAPFELVETLTRPDGAAVSCRITGRAYLDEKDGGSYLYGAFQQHP